MKLMNWPLTLLTQYSHMLLYLWSIGQQDSVNILLHWLTILTNNHNALVQCCQGILVTDISDHFPIIHINYNFTDTVQDVFILKRLCSIPNKNAFLDDLNKVDWNAIYRTRDTQEAFSHFHHVLLSLFNKNFPKKKIKIRYYNKKPWLSAGLKLSIKHKNKLYYKNLKCKIAHYANLLEANKSNMKKTWGILKDIINKNKLTRYNRNLNWMTEV